jgi:tetratricopeptide (TPR) repeat protein
LHEASLAPAWPVSYPASRKMTQPATSDGFVSRKPTWTTSLEPRLTEQQLDQAIAELQQQIQASPQEGVAVGRLWEQLGQLQLRRRQVDGALWSLEIANTLVPLSTRGQFALAASYVATGHIEPARAIYRHLAAAVRMETELLEELAAGLGRVGERELALAVCRDAAQRLPEAAGPQMAIAYYLRRLRRPAATVLPYLKRAFELDPTNVECRVSLAWTLHALGRSADGAELLDQVPLSQLECVRSLMLMRQVFEAACDEHCATACKFQLEALAQRRVRKRK